MSSSSSLYIPREIMVDILSRLPAKSLIRFRCVSTSLLHLIDSSDFVKSHLHQSMENNTSSTSLVFIDHRPNSWLSVDVGSLVNNNSVRPRDHPEVPNKHTICGSCNGLVCLSSDEFGISSLVLWNPSTRKLRKLPKRRMTTKETKEGYGFGYDSVNDDYKVVRMIMAAGRGLTKCVNQVDVYSLKSNSWHVAEKPPHNVYFCHDDMKKSKLASGAIHWADFGKHDSAAAEIHRIIGFDLVTEKFRFVPLPECSSLLCLSLKSFKGCLSLNCIDLGRKIEYCVDIWVMKEYGVKESWTKLISFADPLSPGSAMTLNPLAYADDRTEILVHDECGENKLVWVSRKGKKMDKAVGIAGISSLRDFVTCLGSLVSVSHVSSSNM